MDTLADMIMPEDWPEEWRTKRDPRPARAPHPSVPDTIGPDSSDEPAPDSDSTSAAAVLYVALMVAAGVQILRSNRNPPNPPASPTGLAHSH